MAAVAVYVVRHGDAEPRDSWAGSDKERPLTGRGVREARALVDRFDIGPLGARTHDFNAPKQEPRPTQLLSSSAERCLATLRPLGGACGLPVASAEFLAEGSDAAVVLTRLGELATAGGGVPVICTHGDVIWGIVELLESFKIPLIGTVDVKKGSIWVLETEDGSVKAARYIPPGKV
jgi:broad specificity phosphatase PhoE